MHTAFRVKSKDSKHDIVCGHALQSASVNFCSSDLDEFQVHVCLFSLAELVSFRNYLIESVLISFQMKESRAVKVAAPP